MKPFLPHFLKILTYICLTFLIMAFIGFIINLIVISSPAAIGVLVLIGVISLITFIVAIGTYEE